MTGDGIRSLRTALGMTPTRFASLIGIHPSTLYRWEAIKRIHAHIEPFQQQLLAVVEKVVQGRSRVKVKEIGKVITNGISLHGTMYGLFLLLMSAGFTEVE